MPMPRSSISNSIGALVAAVALLLVGVVVPWEETPVPDVRHVQPAYEAPLELPSYARIPKPTERKLEASQTFEIAVLWGTPILVGATALLLFAILLVRVIRRRISGRKAVATYLSTLLLPILIPVAVIVAAGIANSHQAPAARSMWNGHAGLVFFSLVIPLAIYAGAMIAVLNVVFWATLLIVARIRRRVPSEA